jgi:Mg/Co/Ni transporter MgtE
MDIQNYTVPSTYTILQTVERIELSSGRAAIVVKGKKVLGVVSYGDIARALMRGTDLHAPISEATNRSFRFLKERDEEAAFQIFRSIHATLVPVVNENFELSSVITLTELLEKAVLKA